MEVLVLDGKNYVKASKAAKDLGYATDYVGQLCRSGQIDAHLIGRTWYVHQEMLQNHKTEKKRISRLKAREYAHKTKEEYTKKREEIAQRKVAISYEHDSSDLIPKTRTISVASDSPRHDDSNGSEAGHEVENQGKKIKMKGSIEVYDADTGGPNDGTTILTPRFDRKTRAAKDTLDIAPKKTAQSGTVLVESFTPKEEEVITEEAESVTLPLKDEFTLPSDTTVEIADKLGSEPGQNEDMSPKRSFLDKLAEHEVSTTKATEADEDTNKAIIIRKPSAETSEKKGSLVFITCLVTILIALTISISSVFIEWEEKYNVPTLYDDNVTKKSSFNFDQKTIEKIQVILK